MRKNKMMRTASGLLVATLLTTSVISGTFAKYTTSSEGKDSARVAKWGVTALVSGDLFGADYATTTNEIIVKDSSDPKASVSGRNNDAETNVVAPGTKNSTGVTISISGTPEVANKVTFSSESTENDANKDIFLAAGTYGTMVKVEGVTADNFSEHGKKYYTKSGSDTRTSYVQASTYSDSEEYYVVQDETTIAKKYYPIKWTVTDNTVQSTSTETCTDVANLVSSLKRNLSTNENSSNAPLSKIDKSYTITWEWSFGESNDGVDTILGNLIAADTDAVVVKKSTTTEGQTESYVLPTEDEDYSTEVAFNYSIKVEQVD